MKPWSKTGLQNIYMSFLPLAKEKVFVFALQECTLLLQLLPDTFLLLHRIREQGKEWYTLKDQQNTKIKDVEKRVQKG